MTRKEVFFFSGQMYLFSVFFILFLERIFHKNRNCRAHKEQDYSDDALCIEAKFRRENMRHRTNNQSDNQAVNSLTVLLYQHVDNFAATNTPITAPAPKHTSTGISRFATAEITES